MYYLYVLKPSKKSRRRSRRNKTRTGELRRTFPEKFGEGRARTGEAKQPSPGEGGAGEGWANKDLLPEKVAGEGDARRLKTAAEITGDS